MNKVIGFVGPVFASMYFERGQWIINRFTQEQYGVDNEGRRLTESQLTGAEETKTSVGA